MRRFLELSFIMLLVLPFSVATSPVPPPYHQYLVVGTLERPSGGSRADFAVGLLGWYHNQPDTGYALLPRVSDSEAGEIRFALTDSTGVFSLLVKSPVEADSLKLVVIPSNRPFIWGAPFGKDSLKTVANTESYQAESKPGCSGCGTNPEMQERVVYYSHSISHRTITIPF